MGCVLSLRDVLANEMLVRNVREAVRWMVGWLDGWIESERASGASGGGRRCKHQNESAFSTRSPEERPKMKTYSSTVMALSCFVALSLSLSLATEQRDGY